MTTMVPSEATGSPMPCFCKMSLNSSISRRSLVIQVVLPYCRVKRFVVRFGKGNAKNCQLALDHLRGESLSIFFKSKFCVPLVVGDGGFRRPWDSSTQEILPSFSTLTYEA